MAKKSALWPRVVVRLNLSAWPKRILPLAFYQQEKNQEQVSRVGKHTEFIELVEDDA